MFVVRWIHSIDSLKRLTAEIHGSDLQQRFTKDIHRGDFLGRTRETGLPVTILKVSLKGTSRKSDKPERFGRIDRFGTSSSPTTET
jgi:hypothetical protein